MKIAVTGAMGTGKSTLVAWLAEKLPDYEFFNIDTMVAQLYDDPFFVADLMERFGVAERKAISKIVFEDVQARTWLENLATEMLSAKLEAVYALPRVVVEFPLLFEMAAPYAQFDAVVATWCPPHVQRERIDARDNRDPAHTERMLAAQLDAGTKAALSDVVVDMTEGPTDEVLKALLAIQAKKDLQKRCESFFDSKSIWPVLSALYDRPDRPAHNLTYLARLLDRFDAHRQLAADPRALEMAIWFHLAGMSLSPEHYRETPVQSARLMWNTLTHTGPRWLAYRDTLPLATELIESLAQMRVTSNHLLANASWVPDAELFIDLVMLDYAQPQDALEQHWADTCAELSSMPAMAAHLPYLLLSLVAREHLLLTEGLRAEHEAAVRAGIDHLLSQYPLDTGDEANDDGDDTGDGSEGDTGGAAADLSTEFNLELHELQARVYAGELVGDDDTDPAPGTKPKLELRPWPANKRNTPYEE